jgi:DeoR family fructose operon transcriptional repressor
MWAQERRRLIIEKLRGQQGMAAEGLAEALGVSRETVRRDLLSLEAEGVLKRVHGGAVLAAESQPEPPLSSRLQLRRQEKEAIAHAVVNLLRPGQTCFIDAGSTTALLAVELCRLNGLTIITNSAEVAQTLQSRGATHEVMLLGGLLRPDIPGLHGESTMADIMRFNADIALLSPMALHPEEGAANYMLPEAEIARLMARRSRRVIMLADHAKLGRTGRVQICPSRDITTLVTDREGATHIESFRKAGVTEVVIAEG